MSHQSASCGESHYDALNIAPSATTKEISKAYRIQARRVHPDRNRDDPDAAATFARLHAAYQVLLDPASRAAYDASLAALASAKRKREAMEHDRRAAADALSAREEHARATKRAKTMANASRAHSQSAADAQVAATLAQEVAAVRSSSTPSTSSSAPPPTSTSSRESTEGVEEKETTPLIKIKWKQTVEGGEEEIKNMLGLFGTVVSFISKPGKRKGVVLMESLAAVTSILSPPSLSEFKTRGITVTKMG